MLRIDPAISILRIAMVTDGELGKLDEVPKEAISSEQKADSVGPECRGKAQKQKEQAPGLARFVPDIEILSLADGTYIDHIHLPIGVAVTQDQLGLAARAVNQPLVFRGTGLACSKAVAAMKKNLHLSAFLPLRGQPE